MLMSMVYMVTISMQKKMALAFQPFLAVTELGSVFA
jgi:hypothetical protein